MIFNDAFKNKKVIITGNTGFKGSWLSQWLVQLGAKVHGISKDTPTSPSLFESLNLKEKISHNTIDIRNFTVLNDKIKEIAPDYVFHLAAQAIVSESYSNPLETYSSNVMGTANVLEALKNIDNECVTIVVTSDKCYDNVEWQWGYRETDVIGGKDIYSGSKGAAELVFKSYYNSFFLKNYTNIKLASARAGNVIGGGDWAKERIVPDCFRAWNSKEPVSLRQPMATRPWQFVLEPLSGYLLLAINLQKDQKLNGESYNFGPFSQNNQSVLDLLKDLSKYWDFHGFEPFNINTKTLYNEAGLLKLNCDKALLDLKWTPTLNYDELIEFTGTWYRDFFIENNNIDEKTIEQITKYQNLATQKHT